jgi:hypothetical protein
MLMAVCTGRTLMEALSERAYIELYDFHETGKQKVRYRILDNEPETDTLLDALAALGLVIKVQPDEIEHVEDRKYLIQHFSMTELGLSMLGVKR